MGKKKENYTDNRGFNFTGKTDLHYSIGHTKCKIITKRKGI